MVKLNILPNARPLMKNIFEMVAASQKFDLKIPIVQSTTMPEYKPMAALKTCFKSFDSTFKSNNLGKIVFGDRP